MCCNQFMKKLFQSYWSQLYMKWTFVCLEIFNGEFTCFQIHHSDLHRRVAGQRLTQLPLSLRSQTGGQLMSTETRIHVYSNHLKLSGFCLDVAWSHKHTLICGMLFIEVMMMMIKMTGTMTQDIRRIQPNRKKTVGWDTAWRNSISDSSNEKTRSDRR